MNIDVSIIITNYNRDIYLGRCIRSCLKQSMDRGRYEVIVVDDASTDESKSVIKEFEKDIVPIYLGENIGVAGASNVGIKRAMGSLIIRVDSDDFINEHTLLIMTEIMLSNKEIGFTYPDYLLVDNTEKFISRQNINTIEELYKHGAGVMFRKTNLEAIGLYDETLRHADDYDLLVRYLRNFDGYHLKLPLYRYTQHKGNMTKDVGERTKFRRLVEKKNKLTTKL